MAYGPEALSLPLLLGAEVDNELPDGVGARTANFAGDDPPERLVADFDFLREGLTLWDRKPVEAGSNV